MELLSKSRPQTLLAVDPSLTCSGWAFLDLSSGELRAAGTLSPPGAEHPLHYRLKRLQLLVEDLLDRLELSKDDYLVCEGPAPLVKNPQSSLKVEQVRSVFEVAARTRNVCVPGRVNPRTVHTEVLSLRGRQLAREQVKEIARETAARLFGQRFEQIRSERRESAENNPPRQNNRNLKKKNFEIPQDIVDALLIGVVALSRLQHVRSLGTDSYLLFQNVDRGRRSIRANGLRNTGWNEQDLKKLVRQK